MSMEKKQGNEGKETRQRSWGSKGGEDMASGRSKATPAPHLLTRSPSFCEHEGHTRGEGERVSSAVFDEVMYVSLHR